MEEGKKETQYAKNAFKDHLIYPDTFNKDKKGYRAPYFYLRLEYGFVAFRHKLYLVLAVVI